MCCHYAMLTSYFPPRLRPRPLGSSFFAFLFPKVPLVPPVPSDVSNAGRSPAQDSKLFPSDEELSQRALWIALCIALGWSFLALAGALPLYLINTPCNASYTPSSIYSGGYSTLTDLSLLRLLRLIESGKITSSNISTNEPSDILSMEPRAIISNSDPYHSRIRVIVLTILVILLSVLPALIKIIREFNRVVDYRHRWLEVKCEGKDLGWLSARKAPGFAGWGEKQFKDYLVKIGLSSSLGDAAKRNGGGARPRNGEKTIRRREEERQPLNRPEETNNAEVDVQSLFSIWCEFRPVTKICA